MEASEPKLCDFCRLHCSAGTVTAEIDGHPYEFCSAHCRDAMASSDRVFTRYHGHRRFRPGVAGIDAALSEGCPRNAFVLVSAQSGTRSMALGAELVWRTLQRGEPAVMVTFQEPPSSLVERFAALDWNVLPYLESGQLTVVDCFTYRMAQAEPSREHTSAWTSHLADAVAPATERVRDPTDVAEVTNKIESALDVADAVETGTVTIDSLTEFGSTVQPVQAYDFVKDLRAIVCKARFVPVVAGSTFHGDHQAFPHDLAYVADGVIDCELNGELLEDQMVKRLRVRKLSGVQHVQRWIAYEFVAGRGMVTFDPLATGGAGDAAGDAADGPTQTGRDGPSGDGVSEAASADASGDGDDAEEPREAAEVDAERGDGGRRPSGGDAERDSRSGSEADGADQSGSDDGESARSSADADRGSAPDS